MKKTPLKIALAFAGTIGMVSVAQADSLDELQQDIMAFKNNYVSDIEQLAEEGSTADGLKILPLTTAVNSVCGELYEVLQSKEDFLKGCLNAIKEADESFNIDNVLDLADFEELRQRYIALTSNGTYIVPSKKSKDMQQDFSFQGSQEAIDLGCPGSFTDFENLTSASCVAATTQIMIDSGEAYARQINVAGQEVTRSFKDYCQDNLTIEVSGAQDPHGPWYNELTDVTMCFNEFNNMASATGVVPAGDVRNVYALALSIIQAYENEYENAFPNEGWKSPHDKRVGPGLDLIFKR